MNYGGFWIRFVAYVIDSAIVTIAFVAIMFLLADDGPRVGGRAVHLRGARHPLLGVDAVVQAPGDARQGVVRPEGRRPERRAHLGRAGAGARGGEDHLRRSRCSLAIIIAAFTRNKQALHDFVATTYVVRDTPGRVLPAVALAVLILLSPVIGVMLFGAALVTDAIGPMAAMWARTWRCRSRRRRRPSPPPRPATAGVQPPQSQPEPAAEAPKAPEAPKPATKGREAEVAPAETPKPATHGGARRPGIGSRPRRP